MLNNDKYLPNSLFKFLKFSISPFIFYVIVAQIMCLGWAFESTLMPSYFGNIIDSLSSYSGDKNNAWTVIKYPAIVSIMLWVMSESTSRVAGIMLSYLLPNCEARIRLMLFSHIHKKTYKYFIDKFSGDISTRINDMARYLIECFGTFVKTFIPTLTTAIIGLVVFSKVNYIFAVILSIWLILHLGISVYASKFCTTKADYHSLVYNIMVGKMVDSICNYSTVKSFGRYDEEIEYIKDFQEKERLSYISQLITVEKVKAVLGLLILIGPGIAMNFYAYDCWQKDIITVGSFVTIFHTSLNIAFIVWMVGNEIPMFFSKIGIARQALATIKEGEIEEEQPDKLVINEGKIEFKNITFSYPESEILFQNQNLTIEKGEKIGLVGVSGSGKSTLVNLLLRLIEPSSGQILIDGKDISKVDINTLRNSISIIPQNPALFQRSILENIKYGNPEANIETIKTIAKRAIAHDFIMSFAEGYNYNVGDRGTKLSGGQRQRIAIARAMLKDTKIVILDEATSALDYQTEIEVQKAIQELGKNKTMIVIAHKVTTLLNMDKIVVMHNGAISEVGTHEELMQKDGLYKKMWH